MHTFETFLSKCPFHTKGTQTTSFTSMPASSIPSTGETLSFMMKLSLSLFFHNDLQLSFFFLRMTMCASIFLILGTGVERYLAVCRPHHYHKVYSKHTCEYIPSLKVHIFHKGRLCSQKWMNFRKTSKRPLTPPTHPIFGKQCCAFSGKSVPVALFHYQKSAK